MLMDATDVKISNSQIWNLDTGSNNHMTVRRDQLIDFEASKKTREELIDKNPLWYKE